MWSKTRLTVFYLWRRCVRPGSRDYSPERWGNCTTDSSTSTALQKYSHPLNICAFFHNATANISERYAILKWEINWHPFSHAFSKSGLDRSQKMSEFAACRKLCLGHSKPVVEAASIKGDQKFNFLLSRSLCDSKLPPHIILKLGMGIYCIVHRLSCWISCHEKNFDSWLSR